MKDTTGPDSVCSHSTLWEVMGPWPKVDSNVKLIKPRMELGSSTSASLNGFTF